MIELSLMYLFGVLTGLILGYMLGLVRAAKAYTAWESTKNE